MAWFQRFLAEHPQVAIALAALIAAILEAVTGIVQTTGGLLPAP